MVLFFSVSGPIWCHFIHKQMGGGGGKESLNGPKNMTRRKVKNNSTRLDFSLPPLNAPGSPRTTSEIKQLI